MRRTPAYLPILLATSLSVLTATGVSAHEGHDHGTSSPAPVTATAALRVSAESAELKLVGVLEEGTLTVYRDDVATNRPIEDAVLQVESGAWQPESESACCRLDTGVANRDEISHGRLGHRGKVPGGLCRGEQIAVLPLENPPRGFEVTDLSTYGLARDAAAVGDGLKVNGIGRVLVPHRDHELVV